MYNLTYILLSNYNKKRNEKRAKIWKKELHSVLRYMKQGYSVDEHHKKRLRSKLVYIKELIAYHEAIHHVFEIGSEKLDQYFLDFREPFRYLAYSYKGKESMERAFFSYLLSEYYANSNYDNDDLGELLLSYLDNSTVYCRENILHGLYSIGSISAIEKAFSMFNEKDWYHYPRLISDGLISFPGDKSQLIWRLWRHLRDWKEELMVAVIQFASSVSDEFSQEFLKALDDETVPLEVRFELIRYFQKWNYEPARGFLRKYIIQSKIDTNDLAIVASSVIANYPSDDTIVVLKSAVLSKDWYIRHNAAASLVTLGITLEEIDEIREEGNLDAVNMLEYMIKTEERKVVSV